MRSTACCMPTINGPTLQVDGFMTDTELPTTLEVGRSSNMRCCHMTQRQFSDAVIIPCCHSCRSSLPTMSGERTAYSGNPSRIVLLINCQPVRIAWCAL